jgi:dTDP-4-dehydrorhamnose reductase
MSGINWSIFRVKILITGASGMLGSSLVNYLSKFYDIFATSRGKGVEGEGIEWSCFDLTDIVLLNNYLNEVEPDIVIHCAAIVNVDLCEDHADLATKLHVESTRAISNYLDRNNGRLIYISTDSVFDGKKRRPYDESDLVSPLNVYAKTKLKGEESVQSMTNGLVLRVNIIGQTHSGLPSFAEWILESLTNNMPLNLFYDVKFSPLHVYDLSRIIEKIIQNPIFGLYHCASSDNISKYDFGRKMAEIFQLPSSCINRVSIDDKGKRFKAKRPKNMSLNIEKISTALEYDFPSSIDAIELMKCQYKDK